MLEIAAVREVEAIGLPRIGAGLGGLEWADVRHTLEAIAKPLALDLVIYDL
jgi:O-acetyl-ADP-ribose deacetylase (regulator of RNase III)